MAIEKKKKKRKKTEAKKVETKTNSTFSASELLKGIDHDVLAARMRVGEYSGMNDVELKAAVSGVKRKKSKRDIRASQLLASRKKANVRKEFDRQMRKQEKVVLKQKAIAVVEVPKVDKEEFVVNLGVKSKDLRNFMLKNLASTQFGVTNALDVVLQELNIIMDGGVTSNATAPFLRLNSEIALVALTIKMCELYGLDKATTRKIVEAKIEFMRPRDRDVPVTKSGIIDPTRLPRGVVGTKRKREG